MTTPDLSVVVAVWDHHVKLLPRCLRALDAEAVPMQLIVVDNASSVSINAPSDAELISLSDRRSVGAARNAGLERVRTPFVLFADADDEVAPGSLPRSLDLLRLSPRAPGVLGRSVVDEHDRRTRRGRTPSRLFRLTCQHAPSVAALMWLGAFRCSITTTVLRTETVRDADGFPDADNGEDWILAARLARRGPFVCVDAPVRIYHRHPHATRATHRRPTIAEQLRDICDDCLDDPQSHRVQRATAAVLRRLR